MIGSIFAARYHHLITPPAGLPAAADAAIRDSIGRARYVADLPQVPAALGQEIRDAASAAYIGGMQLAVIVGAGFTLLAAAVAYKYLPSREAAGQPRAALVDSTDPVSTLRG